MSPILIRPVREQLEHDRLIRHLVTKYKKKFEVTANIGDEQVTPVKIGALTLYPDLVWTDGKKLAGVAEVETGESVNNLEAMAQWAHFARAKVPFHLYVPVQGYDATRRLSDANQAKITEIWTYRPLLDGFDCLMKMYADPAQQAAAARRAAAVKVVEPPPPPAPPAPKPPVKAVAKPAKAPAPVKPAPKPVKAPVKAAAKPTKPAKPAKPAAKAKAATKKVAQKAPAKKAAGPKKKGGAGRAR